MNLIRDFHEVNDGQAAGRLIAEAYRKLNLGFASPAEQGRLLAPFCQNGCEELFHAAAIAHVLRDKILDHFTLGGDL